jgi:hypothetical protein
MEFILTAEELNICLSNAFKKKYSHASKQKINLENFIIGNLGEMAYSKYSGLPMDLTIHESVKGDGGVDFPDNTQVKTVTWTGPNKLLKVSKRDLEKYKTIGIQKLVLAAVNVKNIHKIFLVGTITLKDFILHMSPDERFDDCYVVPEHCLSPL